MTLADETVERYSRHILVPEIGPDGQRRLLEARAAVGGMAATRALVADLLERSGLTVVADVTSADVGVVLGRRPPSRWLLPTVVAWATGDRLDAAFLSGAPCAHCFEPPTPITGGHAGALGQALAAFAATALITGTLGAHRGSGVTTLELHGGRLTRTAVDGPGCDRCRATT